MLRSLWLAVVSLCCLVQPLFAKEEAAQKTASIKKIDDLQNGEPIAAVDKAAVDAPLRRAPDFPWLKLSELRKVKFEKNKYELQFDYQVTEGTPQEIVVVFKSLQGRKIRRWSIAGEKEATVRFADVWPTIPAQVEVWIEYGGGLLTPSDSVAGYKISNSVMLGNRGAITSARHWKPEEQKAWDDLVRAKAPPQEPPEGYEFAENKPLLPGMPVLSFVNGEWKEGEYVGMYQKNPIVISPGSTPPASLHAATQAPNRVVVSKRVLEQGEKTPESFKTSIRLLPNSVNPLPNDVVLIPDDLTIYPGTPLRNSWGHSWPVTYAVTEPADGKVELQDSSRLGHGHKTALATLAIEKRVIEELRQPDAKATFAKRFAELNKKWADERRASAHVRDYPGMFPIPDGYGPLGDKTAVKSGDKFLMNWGNEWKSATAISDAPPNGSVEISWDYFPSWKEFVSRKSLFVPLAKEKVPAVAGGDDIPRPAKKPGGGYSLTLEAVTGKKFAVAKVVMDITGLDLADAKDAVDEAPILLSQSLTKETAERFQKQLEASGGKASVRKVE